MLHQLVLVVTVRLTQVLGVGQYTGTYIGEKYSYFAAVHKLNIVELATDFEYAAPLSPNCMRPPSL